MPISKKTINTIHKHIELQRGFAPLKLHQDDVKNFTVNYGVYLYWFDDQIHSTHVLVATNFLTKNDKNYILENISRESEEL